MTKTALRMACAYLAAILSSWVVARLGIQPVSVLAAGSAALAVAALFAIRPAEGLGVFLLFSLLANTWQYLFVADLRYFDEIGLLLLLVVAVVTHGIPPRRLQPGWAEISLAVLVLAGVVSSLLNAVPTQIWLLGLLLLLKGVVFFYLVSWLRIPLPELERIGTVVVAAAVVLLVLGLLELLNPIGFQRAVGLPAYDESRAGLTVVKSLFLHPAVFGWLMVFASLLLYARFLIFRTWWTLLLAMFLDVGAFLSGRRTPILGLVLALLVGLTWYWARQPASRAAARSWVPVVVATSLLLVVFLPAVGGFYSDSIGDYVDTSGAIAEILKEHPDSQRIVGIPSRTALYVASIAIARDHFPFGAGLGRFGSFISRLNYSPLYHEYGIDVVYGLQPGNRVAIDDTFWPSILAEAGLVGLASFGTFMCVLFARAWRARVRVRSRAWMVLQLGVLLTFVQSLVASLTGATFVASPIAYFAFAAIGVLFAVAATDRESRAVTD